jgi:steroid delta-isomerase-like uncharacterized protein
MADNRTTFQRYGDEVWNQGRLDLVDELFTSDHVYHDPVLGELPLGPEGVRQRVGAYMAAVPDAKVTYDDWMVDGDRVLCRWTWGGTNTGELMGLPATGRRASTTGMHLSRFEGGRIAETWVSYDALGFLQQLGVVELRAAEAVA